MTLLPPLAITRRRLLTAGGAALLTSPLGLRAAEAAGATGWAIPIGGGLQSNNEEVWQRLVALSGGAGSPWVVLGTAGETPLESAEAAAQELRRRGAVAQVLPVSPLLASPPIAQAVRDPALVAQVRAARGVFFTGGSQDRIVDNFEPGGQATPLLQAIRALHQGGGVVAGTSAGAAIMSVTMFRDAPSPLGVLKGRFAQGKEIGPGLGFVGPGLFVDQHFLRRGRIGRLIPVMHATGYTLGLGVEENSAAVVRGGEVEVVGGKALLVDLTEARIAPQAGAFSLRGARLSLLDRGDRLTLASRTLTPSAAKLAGQSLEPGAAGYKPYYTEPPFYVDMLADNALTVAMGLLIDARYDELRGIAYDPRPAPGDALGALGFEFRLYKTPGCRGWYSDALGGEDYTVHRLGLDISPIRMAQPAYSPWNG